MICYGARTPPGLPTEWTDDDTAAPCCWGSVDAPDGCTCWEPVYDLDQQPDAPGPRRTRDVRCEDCAYRPGSPEHGTGELPGPKSRPFYCHQGMRRVAAFRHPDGRELPAGPGDYAPPVRDGLPRKADGTPADRCAGWAQQKV